MHQYLTFVNSLFEKILKKVWHGSCIGCRASRWIPRVYSGWAAV